MRRASRSTYVFDAAKLRDLARERGLNSDELHGGMRIRGHRVDVGAYLTGRAVPSSEVLLDLMEILEVGVGPIIHAVFSKRPRPNSDE